MKLAINSKVACDIATKPTLKCVCSQHHVDWLLVKTQEQQKVCVVKNSKRKNCNEQFN